MVLSAVSLRAASAFPEDEVSDAPLRTLASEVTREKLYLKLHQELPYQSTVETEVWKEQKDGSVRIEQTIYVERESQRKIVLGKAGQSIKAIGEASRRELAEIIEKQNRTLYESKAGPLRDLQTAQATLVQARADLTNAEAAVEAVRNRLSILGKTAADRSAHACIRPGHAHHAVRRWLQTDEPGIPGPCQFRRQIECGRIFCRPGHCQNRLHDTPSQSVAPVGRHDNTSPGPFGG